MNRLKAEQYLRKNLHSRDNEILIIVLHLHLTRVNANVFM